MIYIGAGGIEGMCFSEKMGKEKTQQWMEGLFQGCPTPKKLPMLREFLVSPFVQFPEFFLTDSCTYLSITWRLFSFPKKRKNPGHPIGHITQTPGVLLARNIVIGFHSH